VLHRK